MAINLRVALWVCWLISRPLTYLPLTTTGWTSVEIASDILPGIVSFREPRCKRRTDHVLIDSRELPSPDFGPSLIGPTGISLRRCPAAKWIWVTGSLWQHLSAWSYALEHYFNQRFRFHGASAARQQQAGALIGRPSRAAVNCRWRESQEFFFRAVKHFFLPVCVISPRSHLSRKSNRSDITLQNSFWLGFLSKMKCNLKMQTQTHTESYDLWRTKSRFFWFFLSPD